MQKTSNFARRLCNLPVTEGMVQEMRQVFVDNPLMQAALMDPTVSLQEKEGVIYSMLLKKSCYVLLCHLMIFLISHVKDLNMGYILL